MLADRVHRLAEKVVHAHSRQFYRILKCQENALFGTFVRIHIEQILTLVDRRAARYFIVLTSCQHGCERALAGSVRSHDGVNLTRVHREVDALEDLDVLDPGLEIGDFE